MQVEKARKSTRSRMKNVFPIVRSPSKVKGCCAITTAIDPVLIVHANQGHVNRDIRAAMEIWRSTLAGDVAVPSEQASVSWIGIM